MSICKMFFCNDNIKQRKDNHPEKKNYTNSSIKNEIRLHFKKSSD